LVLGLAIVGLAANDKTTITGGGEGTFNADLDGDGDVDGSYFGIGVLLRHDDNDNGENKNSAEGHFVCAMWGNTDFLGLPLMGVEGRITRAAVKVQGRKKVVTLWGRGTVDLGTGPAGFYESVPFEVVVTEGGPGVGTLKLTVIGAFDGVPGDTKPGNGNYDLPVETVFNGMIRFN
jgi:hypothetical protein